MRTIGWTLVDAVSQFLEHHEREAVLGDLLEARESHSRMFFEVAGLALRRHLLLWRNWRPWLAAFGLAWPCTLLLMGFSLTVSRTWLQTLDAALLRGAGWSLPPGLSLLCWQVLLLAGWAWTCGFAVGSLSRRTIWVSAALSGLPCLFCFARFDIESLSRFCLLLFLIPAIWGVSQGLRLHRIRPLPAVILAVTVTALTIPTWTSSGPWLPNWALSWPAWYLVAAALRSHRITG